MIIPETFNDRMSTKKKGKVKSTFFNDYSYRYETKNRFIRFNSSVSF